MKKSILCIFLVFMIVQLMSCQDRTTSNTHPENDTIEIIQENPEIPEYFLVENSNDNSVSVALPDLSNENIDQIITKFINACFEDIGLPKFDLVKSDIDIQTDVNLTDYNDYYIDVDCKISYYSNKIVSIVFDGFLNKKSAAHPIALFKTLNLDINNAKVLQADDICLLSRSNYYLFFEQAKTDFKQLTGNNWSVYENEFEKIFCTFEQFTQQRDVCMYRTDTSVGLSYSVSHALGDHIEVEVPYDTINTG